MMVLSLDRIFSVVGGDGRGSRAAVAPRSTLAPARAVVVGHGSGPGSWSPLRPAPAGPVGGGGGGARVGCPPVRPAPSGPAAVRLGPVGMTRVSGDRGRASSEG